MSQEDEKILKDLVTECLASNGFLDRIQAEIRAGVFAALEDHDVLKDIFINKPLKDFIETSNGALVISLVREFLEFFNLQFTNMVFDPETHAGIDYKFEGREKLADDLNLVCDQKADLPLLGLLLQSMDVRRKENELSTLNGFDKRGGLLNGNEKESLNDSNGLTNNDDQSKVEVVKSEEIRHTDDKISENKADSSNDNGLTSLKHLPPLNDSKPGSGDSSSKIDMKQLNELLQYEPDGGDAHYEEDFVSSGSEKKDKTDTTDSEIEEELPTHSNHSNPDDVTADISISKESGHGDYTEKISNSS